MATEETLRESIADDHALFENMHSGFAYHQIVLDEVGKPIDYIFLEINTTFEKQTGLTRDIIGKRATEVDLEIGKDTPDLIGTYGKVAMTGQPVSFEVYLPTPKHWYAISAYRPKNGFFVTIIDDITERKQAEETLRDNEEKYRTVVDFTYDWEYWMEPDGHFVYCSAACERITGYRAEEFTNDPVLFMSIVHPEDQGVIQPHMEELADSCHTGSHELEFRILHRSGEVRWIAHKCCPVYNREGIYRGRRGCNRDITERTLAEKEKADLQTQLNQAQKMESLGVLAGGIAHDFNNILAVILGYAEMAREDVQPDLPVAKDLDRVLAAAHRAKNLVKQILDFSRQSIVDRMPLNIYPLVKESLKLLRASIPSTVTIKEDIHPQNRTILADPTQVHQIIMNLCTNAYHAMEETGGVLTVGVKTADIDYLTALTTGQITPGEYIEVTVSDTGRGIRPDIIHRIFDPFFTTKEVGKGTGMGLSISQGIIKSYGGTITVESTVGKGTTFYVYFPVTQEKATGVEESKETPKGKGRILFVDDEEMLLEMGRDMLERLGYTVTARRNSIEALESFMNEPHKFELVITDQTMPGMTGTDLARRMLQIRPEIPIILCTGYSTLVNEDSVRAIGIKAFALKPLSTSSTAQLIRKILTGSSMNQVQGNQF